MCDEVLLPPPALLEARDVARAQLAYLSAHRELVEPLVDLFDCMGVSGGGAVCVCVLGGDSFRFSGGGGEGQEHSRARGGRGSRLSAKCVHAWRTRWMNVSSAHTLCRPPCFCVSGLS